jgi:type IV secretion system protein TrbL
MERALDPGVITNLLNAFALVLTGGFGRLMPDAMWLLQRLALLELVMVAIWWGLSDDNAVVAFLTKMLWIGAFVWLVTSWPWLTRMFMTSFIQAGLRGSGGVLTPEDFSNPARIVRFGFEVTAVLAKRIEGYSGLWSIMNLPLMVIEGFVFLGVTIAFGLMAIQIFITFVEFYLVSMLSLILVPFGVLRHTAFIAEKAIGGLVAFGIKLMVLAAIANMLQPVMQTLRLSPQPQLNELISLLLGAWALTLLAWHAPGVAAGMMAGAPTLTASTVAHTALASAAGVGLAGIGAIGAGHLVDSGARRAVRYGSATTAAYRAGGMRGIAQTAGATVAYQTRLLTAGFRGAAASGRIYGANFAAVPWNPGGAGSRAGAGINARMLALRVIPPPAHPGGGISANLHRP